MPLIFLKPALCCAQMVSKHGGSTCECHNLDRYRCVCVHQTTLSVQNPSSWEMEYAFNSGLTGQRRLFLPRRNMFSTNKTIKLMIIKMIKKSIPLHLMVMTSLGLDLTVTFHECPAESPRASSILKDRLNVPCLSNLSTRKVSFPFLTRTPSRNQV